MSSYTTKNYTPLVIESLENDLFQVQKDCCISVVTNHWKITFTIKAGAIWNGASIPKPFRWFLPQIDYTNQLYNYASLVHDCLYATKKVSKYVADDIFRSILRDSGISRIKAGIAHQCLKMAKKHYGVDEHNLKDYFLMDVGN
jgi:hypothetical protein